jgi:oligoribonuclease
MIQRRDDSLVDSWQRTNGHFLPDMRRAATIDAALNYPSGLPAGTATVASNLVWMDLEMTGLDPERDVILEMATIVTDGDLNVIAEGPEIAIAHPEAKLATMDEWNVTHHTASGLLERVRTIGISTVEAEAMTLAFLERHVGKGQSPLCGNTIWQDRRFLIRYMPTLEAFLHYRMIDVSTVKELARRWSPDLLGGFTKENQHLALADIRESIAELLYYRAGFFKLP